MFEFDLGWLYFNRLKVDSQHQHCIFVMRTNAIYPPSYRNICILVERTLTLNITINKSKYCVPAVKPSDCQCFISKGVQRWSSDRRDHVHGVHKLVQSFMSHCSAAHRLTPPALQTFSHAAQPSHGPD